MPGGKLELCPRVGSLDQRHGDGDGKGDEDGEGEGDVDKRVEKSGILDRESPPEPGKL